MLNKIQSLLFSAVSVIVERAVVHGFKVGLANAANTIQNSIINEFQTETLPEAPTVRWDGTRKRELQLQCIALGVDPNGTVEELKQRLIK